MKKLFILPIVAMIAFASCKKDYNCNCVTTNVDTSVITFEIEQDINVSAKNDSKADDACDEYEAKLTADNGGADEVFTLCEIK